MPDIIDFALQNLAQGIITIPIAPGAGEDDNSKSHEGLPDRGTDLLDRAGEQFGYYGAYFASFSLSL